MSMKTFWADKTALIFAAVGVGLMVLTLLWRVNPVEASVVPDFLHGGAGQWVLNLLFVTCMPVFMACMILLGRWPENTWAYPVFAACCLGLQAIIYLLIGKGIGWITRRLFRIASQRAKLVRDRV